MRSEEFAQGYRRTLIEENAHSGNLGQFQASGCVVENSTHLLDSDAWEQLHKLIDPNPVFEVLEESRNRDASATKNPLAAYALRVTLDRRTRRPIQHGFILTLAARRFKTRVRSRTNHSPPPFHDNLRRGVALNAVQIAEILIRDYL
jgi:hypothetical protein